MTADHEARSGRMVNEVLFKNDNPVNFRCAWRQVQAGRAPIVKKPVVNVPVDAASTADHLLRSVDRFADLDGLRRELSL